MAQLAIILEHHQRHWDQQITFLLTAFGKATNERAQNVILALLICQCETKTPGNLFYGVVEEEQRTLQKYCNLKLKTHVPLLEEI